MNCQKLYLILLLTIDDIENSFKIQNAIQMTQSVEKYVSLLAKAKESCDFKIPGSKTQQNMRKDHDKEFIWSHLNFLYKLKYNSMHVYNNYLKF